MGASSSSDAAAAAAASSSCTILLSYQRRGREAHVQLWHSLREAGFSVEGPLPSPFETGRQQQQQATHPVDIAVYSISLRR